MSDAESAHHRRPLDDKPDDDYETGGLLALENVRRTNIRLGRRKVFLVSGDPFSAAVCLDSDGEPEGAELVCASFESESAVASWSGSLSLVRVGSSRAIGYPAGDLDSLGISEASVFQLPENGAPQASVYLDFLRRAADSIAGVMGGAALELEPFDPSSTLNHDEAERWREAVSTISSDGDNTVSVTIDAPDSICEQLRRDLAGDAVYRDVRDALAEPCRGMWLLEALEADDCSVLNSGRPDSPSEPLVPVTHR